ncbi:WecB/TagA/CpsF family glycosyltransferase [Rubritalea spongiae]|uniref:WecB/TagA/CpsF family glycosyltransferase n=1 Tax=Rubritalea spongiae TaxID=430797 RepID=A0ABW5E1E4_9BACT
MGEFTPFQTVDVIGLPVAVTDYSSAIDWIFDRALAADRAYAIEAANTHVAALARHEQEFGEVMAQFDLICPDGMPLVWAINRCLGKRKKEKEESPEKLTDRVYGPTLMLKTIEASEGQPDLKHFFLGGAQSTLEKLHRRFEEQYPGSHIAGSYSPPFGDWPEEEFEKIRENIVASGANLIWVGLGCPKQERWIAKYKEQLPPGCYFGIGAAFAFHAGEVDQAPCWMQRIGMEWFYRLCKEPRRLSKRYFKYNGLFVWYQFNK